MNALAPLGPGPGRGAADAVCHEQRFLAEMDAPASGADDLAAVLAQLEGWLESLGAALAGAVLAPAGLRAESGLSADAAAVNAALAARRRDWPAERTTLAPAGALARCLDHAAILLVFGKFNAGKSSLCNFIARRFADAGRAVSFFHLDGGMIVEDAGPFAEGATETTAHLQGARLGQGLVLLDTPGLHSATGAHADLTRRFLDSADGVLWLTSSAAPGQVQELGELAAELRRGKPLLPVVTRSDMYEEDEIDGALVQQLANKPAAIRAAQEADVAARAREALAAMGVTPDLLRPPVSVSVHMAGRGGPAGDAAALVEAGIEHLYEALRQLAGPARAYKRRKPAEVLLCHLDESVLGGLRREVGTRLARLSQSLDAARADLDAQREDLQDATWRAAMSSLPDLLDRCAATGDGDGLCRALSARLTDALAAAMTAHLPEHRPEPGAPGAAISLAGERDFADAEGGVDPARLHAVLGHQVRDWVLRETEAALGRAAAHLDLLAQQVARLQAVLDTHAAGLDAIRSALRAAHPPQLPTALPIRP